MKVSAIIPAYNAEPWIAEAIKSIQTQTKPVHELIVVDDGSSDRTAHIARLLGADVVTLKENSGEGVARNAGLARATGDAIAWLDADDYWAPNHIEVLTGLLDRNPRASVACAAVQRFGLQTGINTGFAPIGEPGNIFWTAVEHWLHPIIGAMMRTAALREIGGFATDSKYSVDYDMWLRLSRKHEFIATREVTSYWRWHPAQQSSNFQRQLVAVYIIRRRFLEKELREKLKKKQRKKFSDKLVNKWRVFSQPYVGNGQPGEVQSDAKRFAESMRNRWSLDFDTAFNKGNIHLCEALLMVSGLIPDHDPEILIQRLNALESLRATGDRSAG
jgi:glycosyltransferase involved in cell wall biosynthesis